MKEYIHEESVYVVYGENDKRLFGVIGLSQVAHEDDIRATFVHFKAFYKPLWSSELIQLSMGDIRWDGHISCINNPSSRLNGFDDLCSKLLIEYAVYSIIEHEVYVLGNLDDKIQQDNIYNDLDDVFSCNLDYIEVTEDTENITPKLKSFCLKLKEELTQMSCNSLQNQEGDAEE